MKHEEKISRKEKKENSKQIELLISSIERKLEFFNEAYDFYKKNYVKSKNSTFRFNSKNFVFYEIDYYYLGNIFFEFDKIKKSNIESLEKYNRKLKSDTLLSSKKICLESVFNVLRNDFVNIKIDINIDFRCDYDKKNFYFLVDFDFSSYDSYEKYDKYTVSNTFFFDDLIGLVKRSNVNINKGIVYVAKTIYILKKFKYFFQNFKQKQKKALTKDEMKFLFNDLQEISNKSI